VTMATKRKAGRSSPIVEPKRPAHRPKGTAVPFLHDRDRYTVAFYAAHRRVIKMRTLRGNRNLGANAAATWLAMLRKGDLLKGAAVGSVTGAPDGHVGNCPDGYVSVVPMARGKDWPLHSDDVAGPVKTMKRKEAAAWKGDDATKRWFDEAVVIFMLALAAAARGDASKWILARARAEIFGDSKIIDVLRRAPGPKLGKFDPFETLRDVLRD
jgi:hypothetical protein